MSRNDDHNSFPTPAIASAGKKAKSLNLEKVDMSRAGIQGDVYVSKGRSSTFVSAIPDAKESKE
jgi:hypothetical protein